MESRIRVAVAALAISAVVPVLFVLVQGGGPTELPQRTKPRTTPESQVAVRQTVFEVVDPAPFARSVTRIAFLDDGNIHFATLETHQGNAALNRTAIYRYSLESDEVESTVVARSFEVRSFAYSPLTGSYVIGTSGIPQILLYNAENQTTTLIFELPGSFNIWIHDLAVKDQYVYTIISASTIVEGLEPFDGILKLDLVTGEFDIIPFDDQIAQAWGGVESIDPSGRVWFWRDEPRTRSWYDTAFGTRPQQLDGFEAWDVAGWDAWGDDFFLVLTQDGGGVQKVRVDVESLVPRPYDGDAQPTDDAQFLRLIPLDAFHRSGPALSSVYYDPQTLEIFVVDGTAQTIARRGTLENAGTAQPRLAGGRYWPASAESDHPGFVVLGLAPNNVLITWLRGAKSYGTIDLGSGTFAESTVAAPNLTAATITSLVRGPDGYLYGGAGITMSDLFRVDPTSGTVSILDQAVPYGEGQISSLFVGLDGNIYGSAYPGAVLFRYDPSLPWNPGGELGSNPLNLGRMGYSNQSRAYHGIQDLDGNIWYESFGAYRAEVVHALAKIDFESMTTEVKTDADDGFPIVKDLAVFDDTHILLLGERDGADWLFLLNQREFVIEDAQELPGTGGVLLNLSPTDPEHDGLLLALGDTLYRVEDDFTLSVLHRSVGPIRRLVPAPDGDFAIVGQFHVEVFDAMTNSWRVWWRSSGQTTNLIPQPQWDAVTFDGDAVLIGIGERLTKITFAEP